MAALNKHPPKGPPMNPPFAYTASSKASVEQLITDLEALPHPLRLVLLVQIWKLGLMRPKGFALRFLFWFAKRMRGDKGLPIMLKALEQKDPAAVQSFWDQTIAHIRNGKDREDMDSVGGFSQSEIDLIAKILTTLHLLADRQPVAQV